MRSLLKVGLVVLLAALLVGGGVLIYAQSRGDEPDVEAPVGDPVAPVDEESEVVDEPLPPAADEGTQLTEYGPVVIPDLDLTLEVPRSAARLEPLWEWAVADVPEGRLGFNYMPFEPPLEPEAILPNHALVLEGEEVDLGWSEGRAYLLEIYAPAAEGGDTQAPVESVERHILVVTEVAGEEYIFDFYAGAPTAEGLARLEGRLLHLAHVVEGPVVSVPETEEPPVHQMVNVPELNLTFAVPGELEQELEFVWSAYGLQSGVLGFAYTQFEPPMEPESVLPSPAQILESEPVTFAWGEGRQYTMEVFGEAPPAEEGETQAPVESVERHVVVTVEVEGQRYFLDFYASGANAEELAALEPLLQQVMGSVTFG
ncbi:MAG: hypothetical protein ACLFU8_02085 [Anaerolineales bacterium]